MFAGTETSYVYFLLLESFFSSKVSRVNGAGVKNMFREKQRNRPSIKTF